MTENAGVHVPKTKQGGSFTDPQDVDLHANDFSFEERMAELTDDEKQQVERYLRIWEGAQTDVTPAPSPSFPGEVQPWERHYSATRHSFPLKNYIVHAFPVLNNYLDGSSASPAVLECGCGTGSTLLPLMKYSSSKDAVFVGFDVSSTSVKYFSEHEVAQRYLEEKRLFLFTFDITNQPQRPRNSCDDEDEAKRKRLRMEPIDGVGCTLKQKIASEFSGLKDVQFDVVLLVFVLSALRTVEDMRRSLQQLRSVMKPCGVLLFRDYALPDHNFFRFLGKTGGRMENGITFAKGDGTSQAFFERKNVVKLFEAAGFLAESVEYHCNRIVNRKNGKKMDKVFLNATFRVKGE